MLAWRVELEQSEVRAEAALVTILSLTQITELKLLLDVGPAGHKFYALVLGLLVSAISLEILVGAVIIYVGGIHRSRPPSSSGDVGGPRSSRCARLRRVLRHCCCQLSGHAKRRPGRRLGQSVVTLKMLDVKLQDAKQTDEISGHEIAGHENATRENAKHENVLAYIT